MEFSVVGWPEDGPTLDLDHRRFAYAGKFVMSTTGKAVALEGTAGDAPAAETTDDPPAAETTDDPPAAGTTDDPPAAGTTGDSPAEGATDAAGVDAGDVVAAVAFDADRTDDDVLRLRYVTVREGRRGEGVGPRLCAFVARRGRERGFERARIGVNNPYAYEALYKAGFGYTGERTGLAELVLERPAERDPAAYREGMAIYAERDLDRTARAFVDARVDGDPPARLDGDGTDAGG
ncbi:MAG: GNAT family N-acetyltransferase [Haloferacaceae archaeon]